MKVVRATITKPGVQLPWGWATETLTEDAFEMRLVANKQLLEVAKKDKGAVVRTTYLPLAKIDCLDTAEPLSQPGRPPKSKDD